MRRPNGRNYVEERVFYDESGRRESKIKGVLLDNVIISGELISYHSDGETVSHRESGNFYGERLQGAGSCTFYDEKGRREERQEGFFIDGRLFKGLRIVYRHGTVVHRSGRITEVGPLDRLPARRDLS